MSTRPLIKESIFMLNCVGLNPHNQNAATRIRVFVHALMTYHLGVELALQLIFKFTDAYATDGFSALGVAYQVVVKQLVIMTNIQTFVRLLNRVELFWPLSKHSKDLQEEIRYIYSTAKKCFKFCIVVLLSAVFVYALKPAFASARVFPFETYHPVDRSKNPEYAAMYALELTDIFFGGFVIVAFDCLFISLIVQVVCELKAIKCRFAQISSRVDETFSEEGFLAKIKELVFHHSLVLECIKDMNKVYTGFLLNQFVCSLISICGALLTVIGSGLPPDLSHLFRTATFLGTILSQLFVYCAAGTYLIQESESVSFAVYATTDWWARTQPEVRRAYVIVIQRANKTEKLTAGGMFILQLESFTSLLRTALSFFTLVQAMYTRTQEV